jgi:hypothetical protein
MTTNHTTLPLEEDYKTKKSKGSATRTGYTIEARFHVRDPENVGRQIFDQNWRQVEFDQSAIGVPMSTSYHRELLDHGLFSYSAAQALRWWFHAQAEIECVGGAPGLQTRLVQHRVTCTHEVAAIGVVND